jgi:hypothetical protein
MEDPLLWVIICSCAPLVIFELQQYLVFFPSMLVLIYT